MPRPSKLTPEVANRIVTAISAGNTRDVASRYAGIHPATFYRWMGINRRPYSELRESLEKAEADAIVANAATIRQAAQGGAVIRRITRTVTRPDGSTETTVDETRARPEWTAAAWWLERRYPDEWGRKERVTLEHLLKSEAEKMAQELGLTVEDIMADAERILSRSS